ncbi:MAG TPA: hypothetical protein VFL36_23785 [Myxococcales bacterium]|nr:hypothetical protein [Myxococcales bacterium]
MGAWNLAILTPDGIARRLFQLERGTPVEVQVAIDQQAPVRVLHDGLIVIPSRNSLLVQPQTAGTRGLQAAARIVARAIRSLPETPMTAAGVNVRYRLDPVPDELIRVVESTIDPRLADARFVIQYRGLLRQLGWNEGVINCEWHHERNESRVAYNFHLGSTEIQRLAAWVERCDEMVAAASQLTTGSLNVEIAEGDNG